MAMIAWSDEYNVGIQEIDEQHKQLVELMNKLYTAVANKTNRDELWEVLNELVEYTKIHFSIEEALMRIFEYKEYEEHKRIHDKIVERVVELQSNFRAGDNSVGMELILFLKDWLFEHIVKVDKKYSKPFIKGGAKRSWIRKFW